MSFCLYVISRHVIFQLAILSSDKEKKFYMIDTWPKSSNFWQLKCWSVEAGGPVEVVEDVRHVIHLEALEQKVETSALTIQSRGDKTLVRNTLSRPK